MTPTEIRPAIARILMLTAGPANRADTDAITAALAVFDDIDSITELACTTAVETAEKYRAVPGSSAIFVSDPADLIAFGMLSHALAGNRDALDEHIEQLPAAHRAAVAIALLAMWRQACSITACQTLATITVPDSVDEGAP